MRDWKFFLFLYTCQFCLQFKAYLWGIERARTTNWITGDVRFKAYLWGIESPVSEEEKNVLFAIAFKAYLWGIESCTTSVANSLHMPFKAYLWGIERNKIAPAGAWPIAYLKPTYEGLKGISYLKRDLFQFDLKPTYEGLKVIQPQPAAFLAADLKPTYEGLKVLQNIIK